MRTAFEPGSMMRVPMALIQEAFRNGTAIIMPNIPKVIYDRMGLPYEDVGKTGRPPTLTTDAIRAYAERTGDPDALQYLAEEAEARRASDARGAQMGEAVDEGGIPYSASMI